MSSDTALRYPRDAIASVIESAMSGADYAHTAEWTAPESCPCLREGMSCGTVQGQRGIEQCQGYTAHIPLPPDRRISADELIAVLPDPDNDGMVSASAAANALGALASSRMSWCPYRSMTLFDRLGTALDEFEAARRPARQDAGEWLPRCAYCGEPCRSRQAKFCCSAHRHASWKKARRQKDRERKG